MGGDEHAAGGADPSRGGGDQSQPGGFRRLMKALFDVTPWGLDRRIEWLTQSLNEVHARLDLKTDQIETRLDGIESALRATQSELVELRERRVAAAEARLDAAENSVAGVSDEAARLRDRVVPAAVGRADALLERLVGELDELGSLVERILLREPLPAPGRGGLDEGRLSAALARVQPALLDAFRGPGEEILHRLDRYLEALSDASPVLDLGCGRGELLLLLRDAGVEAAGIESDPAVAQATRRRGLEVMEGDVLKVLWELPDSSRGAVTAIHLMEHLEPETILAVLAEVRRVLRPGGLVILECPNPHSLRVGATLYWADPTHRRPLLPETLELYLTTSGFEVDRRELLHPFPEEQLFATVVGDFGLPKEPDARRVSDQLDRVCRRLDELVNGPRDVALWASKPR